MRGSPFLVRAAADRLGLLLSAFQPSGELDDDPFLCLAWVDADPQVSTLRSPALDIFGPSAAIIL